MTGSFMQGENKSRKIYYSWNIFKIGVPLSVTNSDFTGKVVQLVIFLLREKNVMQTIIKISPTSFFSIKISCLPVPVIFLQVLQISEWIAHSVFVEPKSTT